MKWLIGILLGVLFLGPLRPWLGRHWRLLGSVLAGGVVGLMAGNWMLRQGGGPWYLPWLWAAGAAVAFGSVGPAWLQGIAKDGRDDSSDRRR